MSITLAGICAKAGEYSGLGRTGTCTAAGSATTLTDAARLATYAEDVKEGSPVYVNFVNTLTSKFSFDAASKEIRDSDSGMAAYRVGDKVKVSNSTSNDGTYTITVVTADDITVSESVTDEAHGGQTITLTTHEQSWVTEFDNTTGKITFSPGGNTTAVGHTYELWDPVVENRDRVAEAAARALTSHCYYWRLVPLGMLTNGDCQSVTGWTETNISLAVAAHAYPDRFGRYYLAGLATDAAAYAYQLLAVVEDRTWNIAALMQVGGTGGTASITAYDVTGSADITISGDSFSSADAGVWQFHQGSFVVPTDCVQVRFKLNQVTDAKYSNLAWIALWPADTAELPVPDRVVDEGTIGRIFELTQAYDEARGQDWQFTPIDWAWPEHSSYGGLVVRFAHKLASRGPFFYEEQTPYTALTDDDATDDTGTTVCPDDWVNYTAAWLTMEAIAARQQLHHGREHAALYYELAADMHQKANDVASRFVSRRPLRVITRGA